MLSRFLSRTLIASAIMSLREPVVDSQFTGPVVVHATPSTFTGPAIVAVSVRYLDTQTPLSTASLRQ